MRYASTSAFSEGLHSRLSTSLQLRRNHFSTVAVSVKDLVLKAGAKGGINFPVLTCLPSLMGGVLWQDAHDKSLPCLVACALLGNKILIIALMKMEAVRRDFLSVFMVDGSCG